MVAAAWCTPTTGASCRSSPPTWPPRRARRSRGRSGGARSSAMPEVPRQVTTSCPRCGTPIVWSVRAVFAGEQLAVTGYACYCQLSEDEWADLGMEAAEALDGAPGLGGRGARRAAADPPP